MVQACARPASDHSAFGSAQSSPSSSLPAEAPRQPPAFASDSAADMVALSNGLRRKQPQAAPSFLDLTEMGEPMGAESSRPAEEEPLQKGTKEWPLHELVAEPDPKDLATPDRWVPRHRELVRLTGRHPFNCEAPLSLLWSKGFITPVSLHYVRNHGAVPRLDWETHKLRVGGMVHSPREFTMSELVSLLPVYTIPVTLVCAGNRRKEQNMVRKSKGFNWGPAAVSTAYWTGVRMCDLLRLCGVYTPQEGAKHVCFKGVPKELPQGQDGTYGTSLCYRTAMDPGCDVMLAFKQNGRFLLPDHGFPLRMIIPGHIGGRMVKWLDEITVTPEESQNFYHFHDNRVLPPGVDQERANREGWWFKPEYIINELNVNGAITEPGHNELLIPTAKPYHIRGYAYSGGGRKVIRCEVSMDQGETWRIADIQRHVEPTPYAKHWCWVHWSLQIQPVELLRALEIRFRAVDESQNMMPEKITWNLMGMMNNPHYKVKVHADMLDDGRLSLSFEHPVLAGPEAGGWMQDSAAAAAAEVPPPPAKKAVSEATLLSYGMHEIEQHDKRESAWFVHNKKVYDATKFLEGHPGGAESILIVAGQDATDEFNAIHSAKAKAMLAEYLIGTLNEDAPPPAPATPPPADQANGQAAVSVALNPKQRLPFRLAERRELSRDTRLFRFQLQTPTTRLGLPVGQHMFFYGKDKGETVMRAYTPTSSDDDLGHFDLVVKVYFANEHKLYPAGGRMSQILEKMAIGESIDVKGPLGHFIYTGRGAYTSHGKAGTARRMSMIAGGTGITPMFQVIQAVLKDKEDATQISLVFCNRTEADILLRPELDALAQDSRLALHYVCSQPQGEFTCGSTGRICEKLLKGVLHPPGDDTLALMCGPPGMQDLASSVLKGWGFGDDRIIVF